jgi:hypothetical protein
MSSRKLQCRRISDPKYNFKVQGRYGDDKAYPEFLEVDKVGNTLNLFNLIVPNIERRQLELDTVSHLRHAHS